MVTCGRLAGAVDVIAALPMCGYEHVIAGPPGWGRYCYGTPGRAPMKSLHPWRAAPRRHWSTNLHSRHAPEGAAGKEMGQTSNDVTRTLPTNLSPEAVGNAGGSLIAVKKVLTRRVGGQGLTAHHCGAGTYLDRGANEVTRSLS